MDEQENKKHPVEYQQVINVRNKCEQIRKFLNDVEMVCNMIEELAEWRKAE